MSTTKTLSAEVARAIRGILGERQITVKHFALSAGLPPASVDRWLKRGGTYDLDALDAMAGALGMTSIELIDVALGRRLPPPGPVDIDARDTGS